MRKGEVMRVSDCNIDREYEAYCLREELAEEEAEAREMARLKEDRLPEIESEIDDLENDIDCLRVELSDAIDDLEDAEFDGNEALVAELHQEIKCQNEIITSKINRLLDLQRERDEIEGC